ncbi:unnamed protein product [Amoebophrya sp. A25]|nr:unnamed protein product [Amoebophrya sp. A25]|eukprot:GSA25T00023794001.1
MMNKIILVGDAGVGKTRLAQALARSQELLDAEEDHFYAEDDEYVPTPAQTQTLLASSLALHDCGFGGEDVHQALAGYFKDAKLALLVYDASAGLDSFEGVQHWFAQILMNPEECPGCRAIVVGTHADVEADGADAGTGNAKDLIPEVEAFCKERSLPHFLVSSRTRTGILDLRVAVFAAFGLVAPQQSTHLQSRKEMKSRMRQPTSYSLGAGIVNNAEEAELAKEMLQRDCRKKDIFAPKQSEKPPVQKVKIAVLGASGTGKTSLIRRWIAADDGYQDQLNYGRGHPSQRLLRMPQQDVLLDFWEASSSSFLDNTAVRGSVLRGSAAVLLVYDATDPNSLHYLRLVLHGGYLNAVAENPAAGDESETATSFSTKPVLNFVGNKDDVFRPGRSSVVDDAENLARSSCVGHLCCSAMIDDDLSLDHILQDIVHQKNCAEQVEQLGLGNSPGDRDAVVVGQVGVGEGGDPLLEDAANDVNVDEMKAQVTVLEHALEATQKQLMVSKLTLEQQEPSLQSRMQSLGLTESNFGDEHLLLDKVGTIAVAVAGDEEARMSNPRPHSPPEFLVDGLVGDESQSSDLLENKGDQVPSKISAKQDNKNTSPSTTSKVNLLQAGGGDLEVASINVPASSKRILNNSSVVNNTPRAGRGAASSTSAGAFPRLQDAPMPSKRILISTLTKTTANHVDVEGGPDLQSAALDGGKTSKITAPTSARTVRTVNATTPQQVESQPVLVADNTCRSTNAAGAVAAVTSTLNDTDTTTTASSKQADKTILVGQAQREFAAVLEQQRLQREMESLEKALAEARASIAALQQQKGCSQKASSAPSGGGSGAPAVKVESRTSCGSSMDQTVLMSADEEVNKSDIDEVVSSRELDHSTTTVPPGASRKGSCEASKELETLEIEVELVEAEATPTETVRRDDEVDPTSSCGKSSSGTSRAATRATTAGAPVQVDLLELQLENSSKPSTSKNASAAMNVEQIVKMDISCTGSTSSGGGCTSSSSAQHEMNGGATTSMDSSQSASKQDEFWSASSPSKNTIASVATSNSSSKQSQASSCKSSGFSTGTARSSDEQSKNTRKNKSMTLASMVAAAHDCSTDEEQQLSRLLGPPAATGCSGEPANGKGSTMGAIRSSRTSTSHLLQPTASSAKNKEQSATTARINNIKAVVEQQATTSMMPATTSSNTSITKRKTAATSSLSSEGPRADVARSTAASKGRNTPAKNKGDHVGIQHHVENKKTTPRTSSSTSTSRTGPGFRSTGRGGGASERSSSAAPSSCPGNGRVKASRFADPDPLWSARRCSNSRDVIAGGVSTSSKSSSSTSQKTSKNSVVSSSKNTSSKNTSNDGGAPLSARYNKAHLNAIRALPLSARGVVRDSASTSSRSSSKQGPAPSASAAAVVGGTACSSTVSSTSCKSSKQTAVFDTEEPPSTKWTDSMKKQLESAMRLSQAKASRSSRSYSPDARRRRRKNLENDSELENKPALLTRKSATRKNNIVQAPPSAPQQQQQQVGYNRGGAVVQSPLQMVSSAGPLTAPAHSVAVAPSSTGSAGVGISNLRQAMQRASAMTIRVAPAATTASAAAAAPVRSQPHVVQRQSSVLQMQPAQVPIVYGNRTMPVQHMLPVTGNAASGLLQEANGVFGSAYHRCGTAAAAVPGAVTTRVSGNNIISTMSSGVYPSKDASSSGGPTSCSNSKTTTNSVMQLSSSKLSSRAAGGGCSSSSAGEYYYISSSDGGRQTAGSRAYRADTTDEEPQMQTQVGHDHRRQVSKDRNLTTMRKMMDGGKTRVEEKRAGAGMSGKNLKTVSNRRSGNTPVKATRAGGAAAQQNQSTSGVASRSTRASENKIKTTVEDVKDKSTTKNRAPSTSTNTTSKKPATKPYMRPSYTDLVDVDTMGSTSCSIEPRSARSSVLSTAAPSARSSRRTGGRQGVESNKKIVIDASTSSTATTTRSQKTSSAASTPVVHGGGNHVIAASPHYHHDHHQQINYGGYNNFAGPPPAAVMSMLGPAYAQNPQQQHHLSQFQHGRNGFHFAQQHHLHRVDQQHHFQPPGRMYLQADASKSEEDSRASTMTAATHPAQTMLGLGSVFFG